MQITSAAQVADVLEAFIRKRFKVSPDDPHFGLDTDLWSDGYVDSTGLVELLQFLEDRFQVAIPDELVFDPDFVCIRGIARLIFHLAHGSTVAA